MECGVPSSRGHGERTNQHIIGSGAVPVPCADRGGAVAIGPVDGQAPVEGPAVARIRQAVVPFESLNWQRLFHRETVCPVRALDPERHPFEDYRVTSSSGGVYVVGDTLASAANQLLRV